MDHSQTRKRRARKGRVARVRKTLKGTDIRPRMSVCKTNKHLYVQLIDDERSITLAGIGTAAKGSKGKSKESASHLGAEIAKIAKNQKIEQVVFDRGRNKYHGLVAELANAARAAGLQF